MKKSKITSIDVARHAGVSQPVVSRAFSKDTEKVGISKVAREKVLKAAAELGYRPNAIARSLITQRSNIVGVLVSYLDNQFYALALEQLSLRLQEKGYHPLVIVMPNTIENAENVVRDIIHYQIDGLITASVELSSSLCALCTSADIPVVMFNRIQDNAHFSSVTASNYQGGKTAAEYFVKLGCERIAIMTGWKLASTSRDREAGFLDGLNEQVCKIYAQVNGHFDLSKTADATRELFSVPSEKWPDALFIANDYMAMEAMDIMRYECGVKIPEDVNIISYDDIPLAASHSYNLTTLRQPINRMIDSTVKILLNQIEQNENSAEHKIIDSNLIIRGTTSNPS